MFTKILYIFEFRAETYNFGVTYFEHVQKT